MSVLSTSTISAIEQAKKIPIVAVCKHLLPDGESIDDEWVARNPTRHDENPGSFSVNVVNGLFRDFAGNEKGGNDVVALWKYIRQTGTMLTAARELLAEMEGRVTPTDFAYERSEKPSAVCPIMPVPDDAATRKREMNIESLGGIPTIGTYRYLDQQKRLLGYVGIWAADPDGKRKRKTIRPLCYCEMSDGAQRWSYSGPKGDQPRPLYRLEKLGDAKTVVLVEGERKADLGSTFFPSTTAVLGWWGGANAAPFVDLTPIAGRLVVLFPDHDAQEVKDHPGIMVPYEDQPGVKAMHTIGTRLISLGCKVFMVDYQPGVMPGGWDLADAFEEGWTAERVRDYIMANRRDFSKPAVAPTSKQEDDRALWQTKRVYAEIPSFEFPIVGKHIVDAWQNIERLCTIYGIRVRYDLMRKEGEIEFPDGVHANAVATDEVYTMCNISNVPVKALERHLNVISRKNSFHPVVHWVDSQRWDGRNRIDDLVATIHAGASAKQMVKQLLIRWMVSAIALVYRERTGSRGAKPSAHGVLTFTGFTGGGKTSWAQSLAPNDMVLCGASLQVGSKDSEIIVLRSWITELGEVGATFRKSDMEALKAFITRAIDVIRMPYGKVFDPMPRQTVFVSSVNDKDFLADKTGNRRWWVIEADKIDYDHDINIQQLWAQILVLYRQGEQWHLTPDEFAWLSKSNEQHMQPSPIADICNTGLDWAASAAKWSWRSPGDILRWLGKASSSSADCREAAQVMKEHNCEVQISGNNKKFWVPIPR